MYDYNFFSPYISREKDSRTRTLVIVLVCSMLLLAIGGFYAATEIKAWMVKKEIASMKEYLNSQETAQKLKIVNTKKQKLEIMDKYYTAIEEISANIDATDRIKSSLMETMNKAVPKDATFENLTLTQDTIQFQGKAPNWQRVAELEHNLNSLDVFSKVHVATLQEDTAAQNIVTYNVQCTLKDVIKK